MLRQLYIKQSGFISGQLKIVTAFILLVFLTGCDKNEEPLTIEDPDGNIYKTVTIGNQVWMAENLKTTRYSNGEIIGTTVPDTFNTGLGPGPKYQWAYDGDESNSDVYGRLYTWFTVTDVRRICPQGWHVPTDGEWHSLILHLDKNALLDVYESLIAGGKLKEAGTARWSAPNSGADNETGFTALPGGFRYNNGHFYSLGFICIFWSSSEDESNDGNAWARYLDSGRSSFGRSPACKYDANSVRCVKN